MKSAIANSIDTTMASITDGTGPKVEESIDHLNQSVEFQRLMVAHMSRFFSQEGPVPERIHTIVTHAFICGLASGRAITETEALEDMLTC